MKILETKVENINRLFSVTFVLNFTYNRVMLGIKNKNGGITMVSPSVTRSEMSDILDTIYTTKTAINQL